MACEDLRMLVFGAIGNEDKPAHEMQAVFEMRSGSDAEMKALTRLWWQLDEDFSGDVDYEEFLDYFSKSKGDRLLGLRCIRYLIESTSPARRPTPDGDELEDDEKDPEEAQCDKDGGSCTREDIMRTLWPKAQLQDIAYMNRSFEKHSLEELAVPAPPLLKKKRRRQIQANFRHLDSHNEGSVRYTSLVDAGLVDMETAFALQARYDMDGDGMLDEEEFLQMVCPFGLRAHKRVVRANDQVGQPIICCNNGKGFSAFHGWLLDDVFEGLRDKYGLEVSEPDDIKDNFVE